MQTIKYNGTHKNKAYTYLKEYDRGTASITDSHNPIVGITHSKPL